MPLYFLKCRFKCAIRQKDLVRVCRRLYAKSQYSSTVLLPGTTFPIKIRPSQVSQHEKEIQETSKFDEFYNLQWKSRKNHKLFVLHDGPPYANGDVHVGHALNKILKDIINRYKVLSGHRVHYVPGWDCHGLPIEIKAIKTKDYQSMSELDVRDTAQNFASSTIKKQIKAFKRWGVMADWSNLDNCYFTYDKNYEAEELTCFYKLFQRGLIYRDLKPVHWSSSSKTALAEAELEYNNQHISRSIFICFKLITLPDNLLRYSSKTINVIVWTTQPWTIPSNQALCYSKDARYCVVKATDANVMYLLAEKSVDAVSKQIGRPLSIIESFDGRLLDGLKYIHPMDSNMSCKLIASNHVTTTTGSGIVHISCAHGMDDFKIGQEHDLHCESAVDDNGCFTTEAGNQLQGKFVFDEGNQAVIDILSSRDTLLHTHDFVHSYPYDWRTKQPVFVKTSRQWFVNTGELHVDALDALKDVTFLPESGRSAMLSKLTQRAYWCISRQRVWGLPIPVFYHKSTGNVLLDDTTIDHIRNLFLEHGSDCWWKLPMSELLPQSVLDNSDTAGCNDDFERGTDILDIWFDSGVSWAAVLGNIPGMDSPKADLYVEGKDQYGGWFHSSLLTGVGLQGSAPYRKLLVHGFTVSDSGKKMSKSLGNVVDPAVLIDGGKNPQKNPAMGADALRWWVATSNVYNQVSISTKLVADARDSVQKIRQCFRFMLPNLEGYDPAHAPIDASNIRAIDQYYMYRLHKYIDQVTASYERYDFSSVARSTLNFVTNLSKVYFSAIKDRLYCEEETGDLRTSSRAVLYVTLRALMTSVAPILPHLAEEVVMHHPCYDSSSAFDGGWCDSLIDHCRYTKEVVAAVEIALELRDAFNSVIGGTSASEFDVTIIAPHGPLLEQLQALQKSESSSSSELCEIIMSSHCVINPAVVPRSAEEQTRRVKIDCYGTTSDCCVIVNTASAHKCPRCWKKTATSAGNLCTRCTEVLSEPWGR